MPAPHRAHPLRSSVRHACKKGWGAIAEDLKPHLHRSVRGQGLERFAEFSGTWRSSRRT